MFTRSAGPSNPASNSTMSESDQQNGTVNNGTAKGRKARGGAPEGNANAFRHGLRSSKLPSDCRYVENSINTLRRELETAVHDAKGSVTLTDAGLIQSCLRHERRALLCERWLRVEPDLRLDARLQLMRDVSNATDSRDKCIKALDIDRNSQADMLDAIYGERAAGNGESPGERPSAAASVARSTEDDTIPVPTPGVDPGANVEHADHQAPPKGGPNDDPR